MFAVRFFLHTASEIWPKFLASQYASFHGPKKGALFVWKKVPKNTRGNKPCAVTVRRRWVCPLSDLHTKGLQSRHCHWPYVRVKLSEKKGTKRPCSCFVVNICEPWQVLLKVLLVCGRLLSKRKDFKPIVSTKWWYGLARKAQPQVRRIWSEIVQSTLPLFNLQVWPCKVPYTTTYHTMVCSNPALTQFKSFPCLPIQWLNMHPLLVSQIC